MRASSLNKGLYSKTEVFLSGARQNNQEGRQMIHLPVLSHQKL